MTGIARSGSSWPPDAVARTLQLLLRPKGFRTDAKSDMEGFRNVLKLRRDMLGTWAAPRRRRKNISTCLIPTCDGRS